MERNLLSSECFISYNLYIRMWVGSGNKMKSTLCPLEGEIKVLMVLDCISLLLSLIKYYS